MITLTPGTEIEYRGRLLVDGETRSYGPWILGRILSVHHDTMGTFFLIEKFHQARRLEDEYKTWRRVGVLK